MKLDLTAGETEPLSLQGNQFYYESGTEKIKVKISGDETREYELYAGQGFNVRNGGRFNRVEITNLGLSAATIEFDVSDGNKFDNRAKTDTNGIAKVSAEPQCKTRSKTSGTLLATTAAQVLPLDSTRVQAMIIFAGDVFLGDDSSVTNVTGIPWPAGERLIDNNTAPLWVYSVAGTTYKTMQDKK